MRHSCAAGDESRSHGDDEDGPEQPPAAVPPAELQLRADIKFSGQTGAVVGSGRGLATTAATYGLAKDVTLLVRKLPSALFDKNLKQRPCGLLCKLGAAGMLICDVLGLPLTPWVLAEPVGKAAAKIVDEKDKLKAEVKKAKAAAKRRGISPQEAEAEVLRRRVSLPLPTAGEITAAWRRIEKAAARDAAAQAARAAPPNTTPASDPTAIPAAAAAPAPTPAPADAPAPAPDPAVQIPPGAEAASAELIAELMQSKRVGIAIRAARDLEAFIPAPKVCSKDSDESASKADSETDSEEDEEAELATVRYKHALRRLGRAYPCYQFGTVYDPWDTTQVATAANTVPCKCGGRKGQWPWLLQPACLGFCDCDTVESERWVWCYASKCDGDLGSWSR